MEYDFRRIEKEWQSAWKDLKIYQVPNDSSKPKYYVLDMFPYPSGAGLHVGHPLGYIASDIYSRYKRLKGFNVLHPMGFDSFGLPAEQYALDTGQHPAVTTRKNISTFKSQLDNIGFCYDWSREVQTSDPGYYKWTQWIFLKLFGAFFNRKSQKAEPIENLVAILEQEGNAHHICPGNLALRFTADEWKGFDTKSRMDILMDYRLAYCGIGEVNWCEALGTVLANDEVVNGVSERGGYPVVKKKLRQWYLRITEYADRLLEGLDRVDFSEAMKEMQTNWIGKSEGAEVEFLASPGPPAPPKSPPAGGTWGESELSPKSEASKFTPKYQTADRGLYELTKKYALEMRKKPTNEEEVLWELLRGNKTGFHIRRQHIIGPFIVDFACLDKLATIEIDGGYHNDPETKSYDEARTQYLKEKGFTEFRFTNEEVRKDAAAVVNKITTELAKLPSLSKNSEAPQVSPSGGDLEGASPLPASSQVPPSGEDLGGAVIRVYTTRPDTIFGVDFMVIAPEHELVERITTDEQRTKVEEYIAYVKSRSERERMAEKKITGVFTGAYAINPFDGREIPVWISEYVLAGYGTGAIMAVPCGDERDHKFAKHFNIPITNIIGDHYNGEEPNPTKEAVLHNSGFLNGLVMKGAMEVVIEAIESRGIGVRKVNYKMRDAAFSRQRYWGEPFPIRWVDGIAWPIEESELPLELPHVDSYKPGPEGEGPLANIAEWTGRNLETNTMPGYAGSSWYFLRYMDPHNQTEFCNRKVSDYWGQVDIYIGGTEHAVGHLLYSRMWTKVLFDLGLIGHDEPFKKLVNQGMIQGSSRFVYRIDSISHPSSANGKTIEITGDFPVFISHSYHDKFQKGEWTGRELVELVNRHVPYFVVSDDSDFSSITLSAIHVDVNNVDGYELGKDAFKASKPEYSNAVFISEADGKYICGSEVEKMSKSKFNTVNPDDLVAKYGADTFRMYEMFLGPIEMSKPWDTKGIEGVHRFLKKFWRLFFDETKGWIVNDDEPTAEELKTLHQAIRKIESDTERFSFNTAVSAFMIATNELTDQRCHKRKILQPLLILLEPYAPHITEELWSKLGNASSIVDAPFPVFEEKYVRESTKTYPVAINGKTRTELTLPLDVTQEQVETEVLKDIVVQKWLEGKAPKKIIYVKHKMINIVA